MGWAKSKSAPQNRNYSQWAHRVWFMSPWKGIRSRPWYVENPLSQWISSFYSAWFFKTTYKGASQVYQVGPSPRQTHWSVSSSSLGSAIQVLGHPAFALKNSMYLNRVPFSPYFLTVKVQMSNTLSFCTVSVSFSQIVSISTSIISLKSCGVFMNDFLFFTPLKKLTSTNLSEIDVLYPGPLKNLII